jgi:hypothetical protein
MQPAGPKLCHQSLDLLAATSPPSLNFFAFTHTQLNKIQRRRPAGVSETDTSGADVHVID